MRPIRTLDWSDTTRWELYLASELPPAELCTAVMCVAITDGRIVLARSKRGWGLVGGHIEDGETLQEALAREALEEGGFTIGTAQPYAIGKITSSKPVPHQQAGKMYPFPISYIIYYWATTAVSLQPLTGVEILESRSFTPSEITALHISDEPAIMAGWNAYLQQALLPDPQK